MQTFLNSFFASQLKVLTLVDGMRVRGLAPDAAARNAAAAAAFALGDAEATLAHLAGLREQAWLGLQYEAKIVS